MWGVEIKDEEIISLNQYISKTIPIKQMKLLEWKEET